MVLTNVSCVWLRAKETDMSTTLWGHVTWQWIYSLVIGTKMLLTSSHSIQQFIQRLQFKKKFVTFYLFNVFFLKIKFQCFLHLWQQWCSV